MTHKFLRRQRACQALKARCPLPQLLHQLGLGRHARASCCSPLRNGQSASWGIYVRGGRHLWKDFGTGDGGDEIAFLARLKGWDERRDFNRIVDFYEQVAAGLETAPAPPPSVATSPAHAPPDCTHLQPGTADQLARLSALRGISIPALEAATEQPFLVFGQQFDSEVFGVRDQSGWLAEVRRLDGRPFHALGSLPERKSHSLRGSHKNWPLGIVESEPAASIALVEGLPDFLACFDCVGREGKAGCVAPVALLSATVSIAATELARFRGKRVRIFPHHDEAGVNAARRWTEQLQGWAAAIDYFRFGEYPGVNDLADLNRAINDGVLSANSFAVLP